MIHHSVPAIPFLYLLNPLSSYLHPIIFLPSTSPSYSPSAPQSVGPSDLILATGNAAMDFQERKDENLEQRKETAGKRKLLLDNYERNRTPPRHLAKSHVWTMASTANTFGPPLNTPAKVTPEGGSKESIGSGTCGSHVSPIKIPESPTGSGMLRKDEQTLTEETAVVVLTKTCDPPDFPADENRETPIEEAKFITSNNMEEHTNLNDLDISSPSYPHPEMVFVTSCPYTSQTVATKFEIMGGKVVEVLDNIGRDLWDEAVGLYSYLSAPVITEWLARAMCCLEETDIAFLYGEETHCLIEFRDLGANTAFSSIEVSTRGTSNS